MKNLKCLKNDTKIQKKNTFKSISMDENKFLACRLKDQEEF